jgi:hypothetical protein
MAVDERSRRQLYQKLQEVLGQEEAATLMEHLPAGGVGQLATKDDLGLMKDDLRAVRDELEHKIDHRVDVAEQRLLTEIHRTARNLTLSFATIVAILNGVVFAALKLG